MRDVAALAGVSVKTVSRVVNMAGRGLVSGRTGRVAVVVPNLYQPYFAELAERLIHALEERGCTTMLRVAHDREAELPRCWGRRLRRWTASS